MKRNSSSPLLTILTRCFKRPEGLARCQETLLRQSSTNFEHVMINDEIGAGIWWANQQIMHAAEFVNGQYIFILDDDDFLISDSFIAEFKDLIENASSPPDIIIVKGFIDLRLMPLRWELPPQRGGIGAPNFIVSNAVFKRHAKAWNTKRAGDAAFMEAAWTEAPNYNIKWWDKLVFYADPSYGMTEGEKRRAIEGMLLSNGHA